MIFVFIPLNVGAFDVKISTSIEDKPKPDPCEDRWQDILFSIQGPAVFHYRKIFTEDWNFTAREKLEPYEQPLTPIGDTRIQVVPSGPDIKTDALYGSMMVETCWME